MSVSLQKCAEIIGQENVQKLIDAFPGERVYLKREFRDIQSRNKIILDDFYSNDLNRMELALKYSLSVSTIDKIIREGAKR